jgi:hypothetical protein
MQATAGSKWTTTQEQSSIGLVTQLIGKVQRRTG